MTRITSRLAGSGPGRKRDFPGFLKLAVRWALLAPFLAAWSASSAAVVLSSQVEVLLLENVDENWQTVYLENTYANPVVTCTYQLQDAADPPAVIRLRNVGSATFELRAQNPAATPDVGLDPSTATCLVAESGSYSLGGLNIEAGSVIPPGTMENNNWDYATTTTVAPMTAFTNPVVLSQVMTYNDPDWSTSFTSTCNSRGTAWPGGGSSLCVGKHVAEDTDTTRTNETVGYIILEQGSGSLLGGDIVFQATRGANAIDGVDNAGGSYPTGANDYSIGLGTQTAENGGNGGWAVLFGPDPLAGNNIDFAIDEDQIGDAERAHVNEEIAWTAFRDTTPSEAVDDFTVTPMDTPATFSLIANDTGITAATLRFPPQGAGAVSNGGLTLTVAGEGVYTIDDISGEVTFVPEAGFSGQTTPVVYQGDLGFPESTATIRVVINERSLCTANNTTDPYVMGNPAGTDKLIVFQVDDGSGTQTSEAVEILAHNVTAQQQTLNGNPTGLVTDINTFGLDTARNFAFYMDNSQTQSPETLFMFDGNTGEVHEIIGPNAAGGFPDFSSIGVDVCPGGTELGGAAGEYFGGAYYFGVEEDQGCGGGGGDVDGDGEIYDRIYRLDMDFSTYPPQPAGDAVLVWRYDPANAGGVGSGTSHDWGDVLISPEDPDGIPGNGDESLILIDFDRNNAGGGTDFITRIDVTDPANATLVEINAGGVDEVGQGAISFDNTVYVFLASGDEIGTYDVRGAAFDGDGIGQEGGSREIIDAEDNDPNDPANPLAVADQDWPEGTQGVDGSSCVDPTSGLPVTLGRFESRQAGNRMRVKWQTLTETFTVGFNIWGLVAGEWVQLNRDLIRTRRLDSVVPQNYRRSLPLRHLDGEVTQLALTSLDLNGHEEGFGPFLPGESYGEAATFEPVPWAAISAEFAETMIARGYVRDGHRWRKNTRARSRRLARLAEEAGILAHVGIERDGMVEITYDELFAAGIDMAGVRPDHIALTWKGMAVPREITGNRRRFGEDSAIRFYGEAPGGSDALYLAGNRYQLGIDRRAALPLETVKTRAASPDATYLAEVWVEDDRQYANLLPTGDPFHMGIIVAGPAGSVWPPASQPALEITVGDDIDTTLPSSVTINLAALSNLPGQDRNPVDGVVDPDHSVAILVNGEPALLDNPTFKGYGAWQVRGSLAPGVLMPGINEIRIQNLATGYSGYSLKALDAYAVQYQRPAVASDDVLEIGAGPEGDGYLAAGFSSDDIVAYGFAPSPHRPGNLRRLRTRSAAWATGHGVTLPALADEHVRYWVSTADGFGVAASITAAEAPVDLLERQGDYLVIAHPAFVNNASLAAYLAVRESEGYQPVLLDLDDIIAAFGYGMKTPDAITNYLRAAAETFHYDHVLLVGGDVNDYLDHQGTGAISFIPTRYAVTAERLQYTPSDALIADLDGDELADRALGRWPVRTQAELDTVVAKTLQFGSNTGLFDQRRALLIGEEVTLQEGFNFTAQMERLNRLLKSYDDPSNPVRWDDTPGAVDRVYVQEIFDDPAIAPADRLATARQRLRDGINASDGQTLTIFGGHGSPSTWSFSSLLAAGDVTSELTNHGLASLMMPMACYTTYYNETHTNTLAHQLLLGGDMGAVAIHAAATLSGYVQNEAMGREILGAQLREGATLGMAIEQARSRVRDRDVRINWTLLGDPTIRLQ